MAKQNRGPYILAAGAGTQLLTGIPAAWGAFQRPVMLYFGEESGTLREKLLYGLGGEQYSVAENAMFLGDKRVYLRRRRRAFGEKHRIRSQKDRMAWVEKDLKDHGVSTPPAKCTGSPTSRPGCAEPHPAWAPMPPGMRHPQPPWAAGSSVSPPSV